MYHRVVLNTVHLQLPVGKEGGGGGGGGEEGGGGRKEGRGRTGR